MAQKAMPEVIKTKGVIIFTDSMSGVSAKVNGHIVVYAATKAALAHIIKIMALNLADKGVRVNGIAPGVTDTDILAGVAPEILDHAKATIPLQKIGKPEDIANAALFLASDDSAFITGQIISVCGGQSIG